MKSPVNLPKWGMGLEEGTVVRWLKAVGDPVNAGEPLVEIETAKATQEVPADVSGTLVEIRVAEGESAAVNTTIAVIEASDG
jgi:pyruvate/2-oxoglutarate dehydrogenase complex dihydrolipoamide acyltransferase (E2) component